MIIEPQSSGKLEIKTGVKTTIRTNRYIKYRIETISGTIIEGTVTANLPIEITPSIDIKDITLTIDDESVKPVSLVE